MAVDGKNIRAGTLTCIRTFALIVIFSSVCSFAENTHPIRSVDLQNALCEPSQVEINTPEAGITFLSENDVLVYTVCRANGTPALSIRGVFRESDSEHLRAAIFNVSTGNVEYRYDWPTQGHNSFISATANGHLLVVRDHFLDTYDLQGKMLAHLSVETANFHDPVLMAPSDVVNSIAITEIAITTKGVLLTATLVLDTDTLQPLFRWAARNQPETSVIAASPELCAGLQAAGDEKRVVIRKPQDEDWKTIWTGNVPSFVGPFFLSPSRFLVATNSSVLIFNGAGAVESQIKLKTPQQIAISRDGKHLALSVPEDSPSAAFMPSARIDVFDTSFRRIATLTNFANLNSDFTLALSPGGDKLAILGNLHVNVLKITQSR
jgi:hypothetical protein